MSFSGSRTSRTRPLAHWAAAAARTLLRPGAVPSRGGGAPLGSSSRPGLMASHACSGIPVQLKRGVIELKHFTVFFETGDVLDTEANAELPGALRPRRPRAQSRVRLFLHLQSSFEGCGSRARASRKRRASSASCKPVASIPSRRAREGLPAIELGQFELVDATNEWRLKPDSLPPMVSVAKRRLSGASVRAHREHRRKSPPDHSAPQGPERALGRHASRSHAGATGSPRARSRLAASTPRPRPAPSACSCFRCFRASTSTSASSPTRRR